MSEFILQKVHPALALRYANSVQTAYLLRDILRQRIGQLGESETFHFSSNEEIYKSLLKAKDVSSSCGPAAISYTFLARELGLKAKTCSILWKAKADDQAYSGHTLNTVEISRSNFLVDVHAGNVWQESEGRLLNGEDFCEAILESYSHWDFYPSTHGQSLMSNKWGYLKYIFGFWGFDLDTVPEVSAYVEHSHSRPGAMASTSISWFTKNETFEPLLSELKFDTSKAKLYLNRKKYKIKSEQKPVLVKTAGNDSEPLANSSRDANAAET